MIKMTFIFNTEVCRKEIRYMKIKKTVGKTVISVTYFAEIIYWSDL